MVLWKKATTHRITYIHAHTHTRTHMNTWGYTYIYVHKQACFGWIARLLADWLGSNNFVKIASSSKHSIPFTRSRVSQAMRSLHFCVCECYVCVCVSFSSSLPLSRSHSLACHIYFVRAYKFVCAVRVCRALRSLFRTWIVLNRCRFVRVTL